MAEMRSWVILDCNIVIVTYAVSSNTGVVVLSASYDIHWFS